jgi:hypothetical protein
MNTMIEKSQEQIKFENMCCELCLGEYRRSPFKSMGNIIHWLRALGLIQYETVQIGWNKQFNCGEVNLWGQVIATYTFDENRGIPIFKFIETYDWCQDMQENYLANLDKFENPYKKYEINNK